MNQKTKDFINHVDRLYAVAARVGNREVCLQAGSLVVVVRHAVPELRSAWTQFVFSVATDDDHMLNHLKYFYAVVRNLRGHDAVSLIELSRSRRRDQGGCSNRGSGGVNGSRHQKPNQTNGT